MQQRPGPNRVGPKGWLQSLADGLKLAFKEDIMPAAADKVEPGGRYPTCPLVTPAVSPPVGILGR